jgi:predicted transposase/invertase (TIGR01784 family)
LPTDGEDNKPFYLVEVQFQPDEDFYYRLFAELFLFLRQYKPSHPWQIVVIYPNRSVEQEQAPQFGDILTLNRVRRIYLNELEEEAEGSLGIGVVKLVVEPSPKAVEAAKSLIQQAREQISEEITQRDLIDLIETIVIYKLPKKSREEIEAMLGLSELKQTKVYQEAFAEGEQVGEQRGEQKTKLESIPRLLKLGLSLEVIAEALDCPLEVVRQIAQQNE